jgi:prepilin-type N-terminal cleavage/methylation domain-containing protein
MRRRPGFTLIELLVVIIIIVILAGLSVALLNVFFRGSGVRQGAMIVSQALAQTKQAAAETRSVHYLVFSPVDQEGWMEIRKDMNQDGIYQPATDVAIEGRKFDLPKYVVFEKAPGYVALQPSGYLSLFTSTGGVLAEVSASQFDSIMNGNTTATEGEIVLAVMAADGLKKPYRMCMDLDRASGKVRRHFFVHQ